jgi:ABC-type phosphate transport system substrate-binding protein
MRVIRVIPILLWMTVVALNPALAEEPALVVNKNNPVSGLHLKEVRKIFLGKKSFWDNGESIDVFLQEKNEVHEIFVSKTLRKSPRQFTMYWKHILFSGAGIPPRKVVNNHEMLETIGSNTNAIGYISNEFINERIKSVVIMREE